jgi:hypothetical protein
MHSTDNLEDGYVGSGKRLWHSINKHGKENHVCQILEFLPDRKSLVEREKEIVNQEMLNEELCMNLRVGGEGGSSDEVILIWQTSGKNGLQRKLSEDPVFKSYMSTVASTEMSRRHREKLVKYNTFSGKSHKEESKRLIGEANSIKQKGENNSQYGKCWITNEIESKKIYKSDTIPEGWRLGRKINLKK